jgi:hypothetical protein
MIASRAWRKLMSTDGLDTMVLRLVSEGVSIGHEQVAVRSC